MFPATRSSRWRALLEEVPFEAGARIIDRGAVEDWLFVVAEGRVRVHIGERTLLETGPGGVVGEFAVLAPAPRSASATAIEPSLLLRLRRGPVRGAARRPSGDRARRDLDAGADAAGRRRQPSRDGRGVTGAERAARVAECAGSSLLAGQGFALGLTMAWIMIPASAIFLAAYGSELLPVTYIGAAVAGVVSSIAARGGVPTAAARLGGDDESWPGCRSRSWRRGWCCRSSDADWVSFALLVLVPIVVPVGFIFVVGQAGMLLDVRVLKALYARVVAGFALGFVAGGLAGPPLLALLGRTESLLAAAAVGRGVVPRPGGGDATQVSGGARRWSNTQTSTRSARRCARWRATATSCSSSRSRCCRRWRASGSTSSCSTSAARRYDDSDELARFISQFSAIAYGTDIVFLLVLAGLLLRRFGLRYGLTANAVGVLTLRRRDHRRRRPLLGSGATIVFVLIVAARVTDLTFSDGTSRTSLSAAYQAVPTRHARGRPSHGRGPRGARCHRRERRGAARRPGRRAAPTGWCCPSSRAWSCWRGWSWRCSLYREYRVNLLANLRGRTLDPADLTVEEREQPDRDRPPRRERRRTRRAARARHPDDRPASRAAGETPASRRRRTRERPHGRARTAGGSWPRTWRLRPHATASTIRLRR